MADPHAAADGFTLGCNFPAPTPDPYASAGWPSGTDLATRIQDALHGARLAHRTGTLGLYRHQLRLQVAIWSKSAPTLASSSYFMYGSLIQLARLTNNPVPRIPGFSRAFSKAAANASAAAIPALVAGHIVGMNVASQPELGILGHLTSPATPAVVRAEANVLTDTAARKLWARTARAEGLQLQREGPAQASLELLSLASWADRDDLPSTVRKAFCPSSGHCTIDRTRPGFHPLEAADLLTWNHHDPSIPAMAF